MVLAYIQLKMDHKSERTQPNLIAIGLKYNTPFILTYIPIFPFLKFC